MRKQYPSDISREQFEEIRGILEGARKKTKPRNTDLYGAFCAVLYVLKSGCQWRMLPSDFPKWECVYMYFQIWSKKKRRRRKHTGNSFKKNGKRNTKIKSREC